MNPRTQSYERYGLHAIRDLDEKAAWVKHLRGETVPLRDLPFNGDYCTQGTMGGAVCGHPILIDGTCPSAAMHGELTVEVTDEMVDAAYAVLPGWVARELESQLMRAAIEAALRVQVAGP
jgi:hypothetical protein